MQPSWRRGDGKWPLSRDLPTAGNLDWKDTQKGGISGIFLVLLTLMWWKKQAKHVTIKKEYASAVEDVAWVMEQMVLAGGIGCNSRRTKRTRVGDALGDALGAGDSEIGPVKLKRSRVK